ncbi:MAG: TIGR04086 family membrane protein [Clostridia bacterium]|nr:TIGR04086 family membrane protein [Clostridia bacterium]
MGYAEKSVRRRSGNGDGGASSIIKSSFIGFGVSVAVTVVLWFASAAAAYANPDPDSVTAVFGLFTVYIASLSAGFSAAKINKGNALVCGLFSGAVLTLFLFFVSLFFDESYSSGYSLPVSLLLRASMLLMSVFGAFIGSYRRAKPRRRRK